MIMEFSILEFIIGFLFLGAVIHIVMAHTERQFPSIGGYGAKANIFHGLFIAFIALDLYAFKYGIQATINNSLLMGMTDTLILYAVFGGVLFRYIQKKTNQDPH